MSCKNCSSKPGNLPSGCKNNGLCGVNSCDKLTVFDWLTAQCGKTPVTASAIVEVRFKNGRKEIYQNPSELILNIGERVTVEAKSGHDTGRVSVISGLVDLQMKKRGLTTDNHIPKVYRLANKNDIKKQMEARMMEPLLLEEAKGIVAKGSINMKVSYVECQGDKSRATFFFSAEKRVDFRPVIKSLKDKFRLKIDMRQLGSRQDAGRLGGIGDCGRELCCSTWLTDFSTVSTKAARYQQLSLNPQKLAGQCGKLKCCLNYELDNYLEALKIFPKPSVRLNTQKGVAVFQKMDILGGRLWYSYKNEQESFIEVTVNRANHIIAENKKGVIPTGLKEEWN